jgi:hypothetical protein
MTSLFDQNNTQTPEEQREALAAKWKDKSPEEIIKAKVDSDLFISELTSTMDQMRQDLLETRETANQQAKLQDLIDRLENNREQVATPLANDNAQQPSFDMNEIENIVKQKIQETESSKIANANFSVVENKLKEKFGNNYTSILKEKASNLGLSIEDVDQLARKSPAAFFNTLGLNETNDNSFQAPPRSSTNNTSFTPNVKQRTWTYWQELRKTDPKAYYEPKNSLQRMKDAETLGETFKDGDYKLYGH